MEAQRGGESCVQPGGDTAGPLRFRGPRSRWSRRHPALREPREARSGSGVCWAVRQGPKTVPRGGYLDSVLKDKFTRPRGNSGRGGTCPGPLPSLAVSSPACASHTAQAPSTHCNPPPAALGLLPAPESISGHTGNSKLTQVTRAISVSSPPNMLPPPPQYPKSQEKTLLLPNCSGQRLGVSWTLPTPHPHSESC